MRHYTFILILILASFAGICQGTAVHTNDVDAAYAKTIHQRAEKIVSPLAITDSLKAARVIDIVSSQYITLNNIQTNKENTIKAAKAQNTENKEVLAQQVKAQEDIASQAVQKQHGIFLAALSKELTPSQVDQVKDGMTYNVVNITYKGYLEEVPELKDSEKKQIMAWLVEAREHAIDAESAEKKHAWFGKYKGRINNYLSAAGYDLKKLGEEWQKRIKAQQTQGAN